MQFVKTVLTALAGVGLFCGSAFAGDEDADKARKILEKLERKLEQERDKVRDIVEEILDEELASDETPEKSSKKAKPKADQRPYLGVFLNESDQGPAVAEVMEGSPAEKAGLESGDVILKIDGKDVGTTPDVVGAIAERKVGETVKLEVLRGKENLTLTAKLAPRPEELAADFSSPDDEEEVEEEEEGRPGPDRDELRRRIRKFMDRMREGRKDEAKGEDEEEEKREAKRPRRGVKKLLDEALEDEPEEKEESEETLDLDSFEELARRFMEELMQPRDEDEGPSADDPMGRIREFFESKEGQRLMEKIQALVEELMQDENLQKMIEDLIGGGFEPPDMDDEEEGEELVEPKRPARGARAYLGISPAELTDDLRDQLGIENGVVVEDVVEDGPAANAGLKKNDVILSIDGEEVAGLADLRSAIAGKKPGDEVEVQVLRKGKKRTITVELGKKGASLPRDGSREQAADRAMEDLELALHLDPSVEEAMKDLCDTIERHVEDRSEGVRKALEDFRAAIEKARETSEKLQNGQDPAVWIKQMVELAKRFSKDKELYWNLTDKDGKILWRQRLDLDKMIDLATRLAANEAKKASEAIHGTVVTEWQCDEACCKDKRANGEETARSRHIRRELPRWRKEIRERIRRILEGGK